MMSVKKERMSPSMAYLMGAASVPGTARYFTLFGHGPSRLRSDTPGVERVEAMKERVRARARVS